ncbi:response regulator transcription factor [Nocardioides sp.]|uniref:response regulator n=1 Tax=Nocardioides sp. TaxID=35761 RepID=UPI0025D19F68|nr:response regulator transcription factor [Nocardioides sp.]
MSGLGRPSAPARILLVDDHALVRRGVRMILEQEHDLTVVAEAGDGAEAVEVARTVDLDLVVLDIAMPRMTGLQAAREIARRTPRGDPPRMLMLSMHDNEQYFFESLKVGASGYVLKSAADEDLVGACRAALRGEAFVYPGAMSPLVRDYLARLRRGERVPDTVLTEREDEVLKLIAEGLSAKEIAKELTISVRTVDRHRENILGKLGMRDRTQLTRYAIRAGLIEP